MNWQSSANFYKTNLSTKPHKVPAYQIVHCHFQDVSQLPLQVFCLPSTYHVTCVTNKVSETIPWNGHSSASGNLNTISWLSTPKYVMSHTLEWAPTPLNTCLRRDLAVWWTVVSASTGLQWLWEPLSFHASTYQWCQTMFLSIYHHYCTKGKPGLNIPLEVVGLDEKFWGVSLLKRRWSACPRRVARHHRWELCCAWCRPGTAGVQGGCGSHDIWYSQRPLRSVMERSTWLLAKFYHHIRLFLLSSLNINFLSAMSPLQIYNWACAQQAF